MFVQEIQMLHWNERRETGLTVVEPYRQVDCIDMEKVVRLATVFFDVRI